MGLFRRKIAHLTLVCSAVVGASSCTGRVAPVREDETHENPLCEAQTTGPAEARPLTRREYDNTVVDLLGDASHLSLSFPPENEVRGFRNNAAANPANPLLVESYLNAAEAIAQQAVATNLDAVAPCPEGDEAACGQAFVREFGSRAFRRPIEESEAQAFDRLFGAILSEGYGEAVEATLTAMLQSPQFLYRVEGYAAPTPETGAVAVGSHELASRLSYFLTGSMPDADLLLAAGENRLQTDEEVESQARRLLETARAREIAVEFNEQWLGIGRLTGAAREAADVSVSSPDLVSAYRESFRRFVDDVFWSDGKLESLFSSPRLFLDATLAPLYGVEAPPPGEFTSVEVPEERAGLLTQPALLALLAHSDQSAPVLRGVFVREQILCLDVAPPPPDVNNVPPPVDPNATTRERFAQHTAEAGCAFCHKLIDGIGFGYERYDQFGRYRAEENGFPVDQSGEVVGTAPGLDGTFDGAVELSHRLATSQLVRDCFATNFYRYAMGRLEGSADECSLDQVKTRFNGSGGDLRELLVAITLSDAFRYRPAIAAEAP
jgi:hypothetical protein